jgi:hypothetical protein
MGVTSDIKGFSYCCYGVGEYWGPAAANGDLGGIYLRRGEEGGMERRAVRNGTAAVAVLAVRPVLDLRGF